MGGNVAVLDLRPTPLEPVGDLPKQFGVQTHYFQADVSDEVSLRTAFRQAVSALGKLDGIVTAAGIAIDKPFVNQGWDEVNKVIQVNVRNAAVSWEAVQRSDNNECRAWALSSLRKWQSSRCRNKVPRDLSC